MSIFTKKISALTDNIKNDITIMGLENKKLALQKSITNEIAEIQGKITRKYEELGRFTHDLYIENQIPREIFAQHIDGIEQLIKLTEEKNEKISEISQRYDEEISIIKNSHKTQEPPQEKVEKSDLPADDSSPVCPECNNPYLPEEDVFCKSCGNKLSDL